jgi:hypothetical protein
VVAKLGGWRDLETLLRYQRVTDDDQLATHWARGAPAARPGTADAAVPAGAKKPGPPPPRGGPAAFPVLTTTVTWR